MATRAEFGVEEWYHCYTRGVDGRKTFETKSDYERFLQLLYIVNSTKKRHRSDMNSPSTEEIMSMPRPDTLVEIGAYCLMPNHFHLLLQEKNPGSISAFMQKLGTAYTMYFNIRHHRTGSLFIKPFRSRHVADNLYFQRVLQYIHHNPAELYEQKWKEGVVEDIQKLFGELIEYPYSSFSAYQGKDTSTKPILSTVGFDIVTPSDPEEMLKEAAAYYEELAMSRRRLANG